MKATWPSGYGAGFRTTNNPTCGFPTRVRISQLSCVWFPFDVSLTLGNVEGVEFLVLGRFGDFGGVCL